MVKFNFDDLAKNLPDTFRQDKDSNNRKLLKLEALSAARVEEKLAAIEAARDVKRAVGGDLDRIGGCYGAERRGRSDGAFRMIVQAAIAKSLCTGEYDDIRRCLSILLSSGDGDPEKRYGPEEIVIHDRKNYVGVSEIRIPLAGVEGSGLSDGEILDILDELLPGGVGIDTAILYGSFVYTSAGHEDEDRADIKQKGYDDGAYGGYLKYGG